MKIYEVIVVGGEGFDDLKAVLRLRESDCLVQNSNYINGMTSSIKEGVANATGDAFIICLGDMPQLNTECYSSMVEAYMATYSRNAKAIMSPVVNGVRGNPVIFSGAHKKEIMENAQPNGCKSVIDKNARDLLLFESEDVAFLNDIDTPEDYQQLLHESEQRRAN